MEKKHTKNHPHTLLNLPFFCCLRSKWILSLCLACHRGRKSARGKEYPDPLSFSLCSLLSILIHLQSPVWLSQSILLLPSLFNLAVVSSPQGSCLLLASLGTLTCPFPNQSFTLPLNPNGLVLCAPNNDNEFQQESHSWFENCSSGCSLRLPEVLQ